MTASTTKRPYVFVEDRLRGVFEAVLAGNQFSRHYLTHRVIFDDKTIQAAAQKAKAIVEKSFKVSQGCRCGICGKVIPNRPHGMMLLHVKAHDLLQAAEELGQ